MENDATNGQPTPRRCSAWPSLWCLAPGRRELELLVETAERVTGCPECGVEATPHSRREHLVRDIPACGRLLLLVLRKQLWRCAERLRPRRTWTGTSKAIAPRAALPERARRWRVSGSAAASRRWPTGSGQPTRTPKACCRQYFPKHTDMSVHTARDLRAVTPAAQPAAPHRARRPHTRGSHERLTRD